MKIYHNPRCRKSRETLQLIEEKGITVEVVEYLKNVPSAEELKSLLSMLRIPAEKLLRKGEADYKENFKGQTLTDDQWVEAMIKYPKLIERPVVVKDGKAIIGRPPENVLELF